MRGGKGINRTTFPGLFAFYRERFQGRRVMAYYVARLGWMAQCGADNAMVANAQGLVARALGDSVGWREGVTRG
jgi:hypothetical protein